MAYKLIGDPAINRANWRGAANNWTIISKTNPASNRGILKSVLVHPHASGTVKIKIFRDDGTNYVFIGESALVAVTLDVVNEIPCWIPVESGDLIGFYNPPAGGADIHCGTIGEGGTSACYKAGDVVTTTLKTAWTTSNSYNSVEGKVFTRVAPFHYKELL